MIPVLIGQAPSRTSARSAAMTALEGKSGRRLASFAGLSGEQLFALTERENLFASFPGKSGKGDRFNAKLAHARADAMTPRLAGRVVVFLGYRVAAAFGFEEEPFIVMPHRGFSAVMIPHPSGINSFYNSAANRRRAGDCLRLVLALSIKREGGKLCHLKGS